jgi:predicted SAM-dependent methyltransferase
MDPSRCLTEVHRILRTNGIIAVNVPNHFSLSGRINIARGSGVDSINPDYPPLADGAAL